MGLTRTFTPPNRLAKALIETGGRTAEEVVANANARLESLEGSLREAVDEQLERIMTLYKEGDDAIRNRSLELGDAALNIAEIAGAAKLPALGETARGLHAMVDGLLTTGEWHREAASLHISALTLLSIPGGLSGPEANTMLTRLQTMRQAVGVPE